MAITISKGCMHQRGPSWSRINVCTNVVKVDPGSTSLGSRKLL